MSGSERRPTASARKSVGQGDKPGWRRELRWRLRQHMWLKGTGTTVFMVLFFIVYLHLLHHPEFAVTLIPETGFDRWIGFHPWALVPYLTLWVYVSLPPALMPDRPTLLRYGVAVGLMCAVGLMIFWIWPNAVPPMQLNWGGMPGFDQLKHIDGAGNACPSLHVASALFSGIWLHRILRDIDSPPSLRLANLLWCLVIVYSTMAIKQHLLLDVLAGGLLGGVAAAASLRWVTRRG